MTHQNHEMQQKQNGRRRPQRTFWRRPRGVSAAPRCINRKEKCRLLSTSAPRRIPTSKQARKLRPKKQPAAGCWSIQSWAEKWQAANNRRLRIEGDQAMGDWRSRENWGSKATGLCPIGGDPGRRWTAAVAGMRANAEGESDRWRRQPELSLCN